MVYAVCTDGSKTAEEMIVKTHGKPTLKIEAFTEEGHSGHNVLLWIKPEGEMLLSNSLGSGKVFRGSNLVEILEGLASDSR